MPSISVNFESGRDDEPSWDFTIRLEDDVAYGAWMIINRAMDMLLDCRDRTDAVQPSMKPGIDLALDGLPKAKPSVSGWRDPNVKDRPAPTESFVRPRPIRDEPQA